MQIGINMSLAENAILKDKDSTYVNVQKPDIQNSDLSKILIQVVLILYNFFSQEHFSTLVFKIW